VSTSGQGWKAAIKEKILLGLLTTMLGALGYVLQHLAQQGVSPFLASVLPALDKESLLSLALLLLLTNLILSALVFFLIFKESKRNYIYDPKIGWYTHKKTNDVACSSCMTKGIISPVRMIGPSEYKCSNKDCAVSFFSHR
jgi:hypothetical protein